VRAAYLLKITGEKMKNLNEDDVREYLNRVPNGANRDTEGLGTVRVAGGAFIIGSVDEINGAGGEEVSEFVATRHELEQLAKYWAIERLDQDFWLFLYQQTGSSEWRWSVYIDRRLGSLREILGPKAMETIWKDSIELFRKRHPKITDEDWRIFTKGTKAEQESWRDKVFREEEIAAQVVTAEEAGELHATVGTRQESDYAPRQT
jgi:hypothetical protein